MAKNVNDKNWTLAAQWDGRRYSEATDVPTFTAPSGLSVTPSGTTNALSWTNGTASVQTSIEKSLTGSSGWSVIAVKDAGVTSHNDEGLADGTYYYRARHVFDGNYTGYTSNASGTISGAVNGASLSSGTLTITGSGFPTKTRAAPTWWDNFAGEAEGATLNGRPPIIDNANGTDTWSGTYRGTGQRPYATLVNNRVAGKPSARHDFTDSNYNCSLDVRHSLADARTPVYISYWWKSNPVSGMRQIKPFALYGTRDSTIPEFYTGMGNYENLPGSGLPTYDAAWRTAFIDTGITNTAVRGLINWDAVLNRFIKIELCLIQSDAATANGMYACRIYDPDHPDGARTYSVLRENVATRGTGGFVWRQFAFGHYADQASGYTMGTCPVYTDDIYIDDSENHARVVIGNSATYLNCTRVEDQPATAWSSSSITCTFNKGAFGSGQTAHVFIVTGAGHSGNGNSTYIGSVTVP